MPSYRQCIGFGKLIDWKPEDEVQAILLDHIASNPYTTVQALRQWGKTEIQAVHGAAGIALGEPCGIGMPTLAQGGRILAARTEKRIERFEKLPGVDSKRLIDNALYKMWDWDESSVMAVVSMHEPDGNEKNTTKVSQQRKGKSVQGYTIQNLKIDEAHECGIDVYSKLRRTTDRYRLRNLATISSLGVGGYPGSLIEQMKQSKEFRSIRVIPDLDYKYVPKGKGFVETDIETIYNLLHYCPEKTEFYQKDREVSTEQDWSQMCLCETQHGGSGLIFPKLLNESNLNERMKPWKSVDIDVGAGDDPTVLSIFRHDGARRDLWKTYRLVEHDVDVTVKWAVDILESIYDDRLDPAKVRFEKNGPGKQFGIKLRKDYYPWNRAVGVHTSDQGPRGKQGKKTRWLEKAQRDAATEAFTCSDRYAYDVLTKLSYDVDDQGQYDWPHNDVLSTVWLEYSGAGNVAGI